MLMLLGVPVSPCLPRAHARGPGVVRWLLEGSRVREGVVEVRGWQVMYAELSTSLRLSVPYNGGTGLLTDTLQLGMPQGLWVVPLQWVCEDACVGLWWPLE